ncbi:hypothetical protein COP2_025412 [Malus domestica]
MVKIYLESISHYVCCDVKERFDFQRLGRRHRRLHGEAEEGLQQVRQEQRRQDLLQRAQGRFDDLGSETASLKKVQRIMAEFDKDGNGHIDIMEFAEIIKGGSTKELRDAFDLSTISIFKSPNL